MRMPLKIRGFHLQFADFTYNLRIPLTICGFHLQLADSTYNVRIPLTVAEPATAQFNDTNNLSFVCGFHKLFWIPQILLRIPQIRLFLERF